MRSEVSSTFSGTSKIVYCWRLYCITQQMNPIWISVSFCSFSHDAQKWTHLLIFQASFRISCSSFDSASLQRLQNFSRFVHVCFMWVMVVLMNCNSFCFLWNELRFWEGLYGISLMTTSVKKLIENPISFVRFVLDKDVWTPHAEFLWDRTIPLFWGHKP